MARQKNPANPMIYTLVETYGMKPSLAKAITKMFNNERIAEMVAKDTDSLREAVASASLEIKKAVDEVEANKAYAEAKEILGTFRSSLKETVTPYKLAIQLQLAFLEHKKKS